jgi:dihydroorotate dehydrogenase
LTFANPLGMAAGYDKNAEVPDALLSLGFGFAEVGTVTPLPQAGNPKPRIFRLAEDEAVINRLGFNNEGHDAAERRLSARGGKGGIVGVNIGANKDSVDRIADYEKGVSRFAPLASYLTINISSPNTPGLRTMQAREQLAELLARVMTARGQAAAQPPVFLKIAPDLVEAELEDIAAEVLEKKIDGVIVSNTTISRPALKAAVHAGETGGLSGKPLFERSTIILAKMRRLLGPAIAVVGVGGVDSAEAAAEKIRAGADLVQLYTGMIYAGPSLPARIVRGMSGIVAREGVRSIRDLRDTRLAEWAERPLQGGSEGRP